jgi:UPF0716 protein FxsA
MAYLLLLLVVVLIVWPVLEIVLIVVLAQHLGLLGTLAILLGGGVAGVALMRWQGFENWRRINEEMQQGTLPAEALVDSLLIFAAGVLLFLPGLLTDLAAILLLVPWTRSLFKLSLGAWFRANVTVQTYVDGRPVEEGVIDSHVVRRREEEEPEPVRLPPPQ